MTVRKIAVRSAVAPAERPSNSRGQLEEIRAKSGRCYSFFVEPQAQPTLVVINGGTGQGKTRASKDPNLKVLAKVNNAADVTAWNLARQIINWRSPNSKNRTLAETVAIARTVNIAKNRFLKSIGKRRDQMEQKSAKEAAKFVLDGKSPDMEARRMIRQSIQQTQIIHPQMQATVNASESALIHSQNILATKKKRQMTTEQKRVRALGFVEEDIAEIMQHLLSKKVNIVVEYSDARHYWEFSLGNKREFPVLSRLKRMGYHVKPVLVECKDSYESLCQAILLRKSDQDPDLNKCNVTMGCIAPAAFFFEASANCYLAEDESNKIDGESDSIIDDLIVIERRRAQRKDSVEGITAADILAKQRRARDPTYEYTLTRVTKSMLMTSKFASRFIARRPGIFKTLLDTPAWNEVQKGLSVAFRDDWFPHEYQFSEALQQALKDLQQTPSYKEIQAEEDLAKEIIHKAQTLVSSTSDSVAPLDAQGGCCIVM